MEGIRVVITDAAANKLRIIAQREYRAPRQQAAVLLQAAIERADIQATDETDTPRTAREAAPR